MKRSVLTVALLLLGAAGAAHAQLRVDLLVFQPPAPGGEYIALTARPLPPCHAVLLRDGAGAEAAFGGDAACERKAGLETVYTGYAAAGAADLPNPVARLKKAGYALLLSRGWRQANGGLSPVLLRNERRVAGEPELEGTLAVSGSEKLVEVTLDLVLTREAGGKPEYVRLRETRRMKPGEPHYFDHPLLGAVLQVTSVP